MLVVLFDIDGTLLEAGGAGGTAVRMALAQRFGVTEPAHVPFSGRTDRGIGAAMFQAHGIENTDQNWETLCTAYVDELARQLPLHAGMVLPGITSILETLSKTDHMTLGLLTGNVRSAADLKLKHYELRSFFSFGGFGDHHHDRDCVARDAVTAFESTRNGIPATRIVVVGDTPLDVSCARAIDAEVIAVTTGLHSRDELEQTQPDLLLDDLANPQPLYEFLQLV